MGQSDLIAIITPSDLPALGYRWDSEKLERIVTVRGKVVEHTVITKTDEEEEIECQQ